MRPISPPSAPRQGRCLWGEGVSSAHRDPARSPRRTFLTRGSPAPQDDPDTGVTGDIPAACARPGEVLLRRCGLSAPSPTPRTAPRGCRAVWTRRAGAVRLSWCATRVRLAAQGGSPREGPAGHRCVHEPGACGSAARRARPIPRGPVESAGGRRRAGEPLCARRAPTAPSPRGPDCSSPRAARPVRCPRRRPPASRTASTGASGRR